MESPGLFLLSAVVGEDAHNRCNSRNGSTQCSHCSLEIKGIADDPGKQCNANGGTKDRGECQSVSPLHKPVLNVMPVLLLFLGEGYDSLGRIGASLVVALELRGRRQRARVTLVGYHITLCVAILLVLCLAILYLLHIPSLPCGSHCLWHSSLGPASLRRSAVPHEEWGSRQFQAST